MTEPAKIQTLPKRTPKIKMVGGREVTTLGGLHPDDPKVYEIHPPSGQYLDYPILTLEERIKGAVRPYHGSMTHNCGDSLR